MDKEFLEYIDDGTAGYKEPERTAENDILLIRLYCDHEGCNRYIMGYEGYNGGFHAETGQYADLRNQVWKCSKHSK